MTRAERWRRVQQLCEAVEHLPQDDLPVTLGNLEPDDSLRKEVLELLQHLRTERRVQEELASRAGSESADVPVSIGNVQIEARLGAGGFGEVFRGVRRVNGVAQTVAVKLFHAHRATPEDLDRFGREQEMLAGLTHPDIVRFFDAGLTPAGRSYLVMELVDGEPITSYADRHTLSVAARLELVLAVCDAVDSAHRHLIVHLDLKPANILVTREGHVKLVDFGTAKLVDPIAGLTHTEPLTLLYASPERLRGNPVSVSSDVYSLGIVLYELLSGAWPFDGRESILSVAERAAGGLEVRPLGGKAGNVTDAAAAARGVSPARLQALLRGDLEAVCGKALAHSPDGRYRSVGELADDIRRHRMGLPVRAVPLNWRYRLAKFSRRHRRAVAGSVLLALSLIGTTLYSAYQANLARRSAERADVQNQFLTSLFRLPGTDAESHTAMTVRELLSLAEARIAPVLGKDPSVAADIERALADGFISQGDFVRAERLLETLARRAHEGGDVRNEVLARAVLAYVFYTQNRNDRAVSEARLAMDLWDRAQDQFLPRESADALRWAAGTLSYVNPLDDTVRPRFATCVDLGRRLADEVPPGTRAACLTGMAIPLISVDSRYAEALSLLDEAIALTRPDPALAAQASMSLQLLGLANRHLGNARADEQAQKEALAIQTRVLGPQSAVTLWQRAVWVTSLAGIGEVDAARREAQEVLRQARVHYPERGSYLLWTPLSAAMTAACLTPEWTECETLASEALETLGPTPSPDDARWHVARGFLGLAWAHRGRHREALPLLEGALAMNVARKRSPSFLPAIEAAIQTARSARTP